VQGGCLRYEEHVWARDRSLMLAIESKRANERSGMCLLHRDHRRREIFLRFRSRLAHEHRGQFLELGNKRARERRRGMCLRDGEHVGA
jgi:hypothetical protein